MFLDDWSLYYFDFIKNYLDENIHKKKHLFNLSKNENVTENTILNNLHIKWNINGLCQNPNLSVYFIKDIIEKEKIECTEREYDDYKNNLSRNPNFKLEYFDLDDFKNIKKDTFSLNPNVKWEDIEKTVDFNINNRIYIQPLNEFPWNFEYLSSNQNITLENIISTQYFLWNNEEIIKNPIFTINDFQYEIFRYKKNNIAYFQNPNFDFIEYIQLFPIHNICDDIYDYYMYKNDNFTIKTHDDILHYFPDYEFDYSLLSNKKNISLEYIFQYPNRNWFHNGKYLKNPHITFDFLIQNQYHINNKDYISENKFTKQKEIYIKNRL
jgi:hypothetical protein